MNTIHSGRRVGAWAGLVLESYLLFVFVNSALPIPYPYDWKRVGSLVTSALAASVAAYGSGRLLGLAGERASSWRKPLVSLPFVDWEPVVAAVAMVIVAQLL